MSGQPMRYAHDIRIIVRGRMSAKRYSALANAMEDAARKTLGRDWIMFGPDKPGVLVRSPTEGMPKRWWGPLSPRRKGRGR